MQFNPDPNKQANEVCFSRRRNPYHHPSFSFNINIVQTSPSQKHLGLILDNKLDFNQHIDEKIKNCNRIIGIMKRLSLSLPRKSLLTIYKSFIRPHLDYADIIYDNPKNEYLKNKLESIQYNAAFAIPGVIKGTSQERLYQELGLKFLSDRQWYRKLVFLYKIVNDLTPEYLKPCINISSKNGCQTRSAS